MRPDHRIRLVVQQFLKWLGKTLPTDDSTLRLLRDKRLGALALANMLDTMSTTVVVPVLPRLADELGASPFLIGVMFAVPAIVGALVQIPGGYLSDRWGRKRVIAGGMSLSSLPVIAIAFAWSPLVLVVVRGFDGFFRSFVSPATNAYLGDQFMESERGQAFSVYHTAGMMGAAVGPVFGGLIAEVGGVELPFLVLGTGTLLGGLTLVVFLPAKTRTPDTNEQHTSSLLPDFSNFDPSDYLSVAVAGWLAVVFIDQFGSTALRPSIAPLLNETIGRGPAYVGTTYSALAVGMLLFLPVGGRVTDRAGRIRVLLFSFFGWSVVMVALAVATHPLVPPILMFLGGVLSALAVPALYALRYELAPDGREATFSGVTGTAESIGEAIGPLYAGAAIGLWGVQLTVIAAGISWLVALPLIGFLIPARTDRGDV